LARPGAAVDWACGAGVAAFTAWTAWTAAPAAGWMDCGELGAAAFHLGVPHPTGFPAWVIACKAFTLVPLGTVAVRANLSSALFACALFALLAAFLRELGRSRALPAPAVVGAVAACGLALASSPVAVMHSTAAEVYALSAALCVAAAAAAGRLLPGTADRGDPRPRVAGIALLVAAGPLVHAEIAIAAALPLGLFFLLDGEKRRAVLGGGLLAGLVLAGGALFLLVRSRTGPPLDWGDPETVPALLAHLSGGRIRAAFGDRMLSLPQLETNARLLLGFAAENVPPFAAALAAAGTAFLLRRGRAAGVAVILLAAAGAAYVLFVNPMGMRDRQVGMVIVALVALAAGAGAAWIAAAAARAAGMLGGRPATALVLPWSAAALMAALLAPAALFPGRLFRPARDRTPVRWAENAWKQAPPFTIVLCESDNLCAISLYLQSVEGERPDLLVLPRQHLWDDRMLALKTRRHHGALAARLAPLPRDAGKRLAALVAWAQGRHDVAWEAGSAEDEQAAFGGERPAPLAFEEGGVRFPLAALAGTGSLPGDLGGVALYRHEKWIRNRREGDGPLDYAAVPFLTRRAIAHDLVVAGNILMRAGGADEARACWEEADRIGGGYAAALVNLAVLAASAGERDRAIALAREALRLDPANGPARKLLDKLGGGGKK